MNDLFQYFSIDLAGLSMAALFAVFFFGTFVSEDAACLLAGTAAASGRTSFMFALVSCFFGIFVGDLLLFGAGRVFGVRLFNNRFVTRFISNKTINKASVWLEKNGALAVFLSRFVTGLRLPTYLLAGALRTDFWKFAGYFLLASSIWTPILVGTTAFSQRFLFPKNTIAGVLAIAVALKVAFSLSSYKNRRLLVGRLKRILNWEFWPLPVFYAPVVVCVLLLAIKHRSLSVFTYANSAILAGGFKGESKDEIYKGLMHSCAAQDHLLRHTLVPCEFSLEKKIAAVWKFLDEGRLCFPLVVKPDAGERGKGVKIVRSFWELRDELKTSTANLILQELAPGNEVSIFYYRYPSQKHGQIFSITEKRFPTVTGDGVDTLERLILSDSRAVCLAKKYLEQNVAKLDSVPANDERIQIIDIGTHSRGAIFLDGSHIKTEALAQKIDEICRGFDGFYFGRFDIRYQSLDDLKRGENFKIIELNGVTSESTNIYDPRYNLLDAYRILFRQWQIVFEIGSENRKLGAKGASFAELMRLAFARS
jgi:membrane protein DedA with SNARE-associated domain